MLPYQLLSGTYLGWALGRNDSSNIFGPAIAAKALKLSHAVILCASFVIIGSMLQGAGGFATLGSLTSLSVSMAFITSLSSAFTVTAMNLLKLPASTSQAMVGSLLCAGLLQRKLNMLDLDKVLLCWVATPLAAACLAYAGYKLIGLLINALPINIFTQDRLVRIGLICAGAYSAYALGANNVANVTGVYVASSLLEPRLAALLGGVCIALGVFSFSKKVMLTVGKRLVALDSYSAFITVLAVGLTVHFFAFVGVPVSTSQAVIGAVLGIGLLKGVQTINLKILFLVLFGWIGTPLIAMLLTFGLFTIYNVII
ncbi:MAG: inorganic phosphate transporter [Spirochaetia bacterium]